MYNMGKMNKIIKASFINSLLTLIYITIIATIIRNGNAIFGEMDNWLSPIAFLLMFTLSALVVGVLILGKPIMFYLDGKKQEAVSLLVYTIAWVGAFTLLAIAIMALIK